MANQENRTVEIVNQKLLFESGTEVVGVAGKVLDKFVEDNDGFDQVALTPEEQVDLVSKLSIDDMEQLAGIFGPDVVLTARDEILKGAFSNGGGI